MPDLGAVDPMPVRTLPGCEQEVDSGALGSARSRRTPGFSVVPTLWVGLEPQLLDYRRGLVNRLLPGPNAATAA